MRTLLSAALILGLFAVVGWAAAVEHTKDSLDEVKKAFDAEKAVLLDVREPAETKAGYVAGAVLIPLSRLKEAAKDPNLPSDLSKKLPSDKPIYCHCRSGVRSLTACEILQKLGYDVRPLKPGYSDLIKAGFPKADTPPEPE